MTRSIDNVYAVIIPCTCSSRRSDNYASFLLLLHSVPCNWEYLLTILRETRQINLDIGGCIDEAKREKLEYISSYQFRYLKCCKFCPGVFFFLMVKQPLNLQMNVYILMENGQQNQYLLWEALREKRTLDHGIRIWNFLVWMGIFLLMFFVEFIFV